MSEVDIATLAVRLLGVSAVVLLLPGLAFLAALRVSAEWHHHLVLAFALSYSWIFLLSIVVPLGGWTVDHAVALTLVLIVGLSGVTIARMRARDTTGPLPSNGRLELLLIGAVVFASAVAAWFIESPFTGEEVLDLASLSRFADGGAITFENTSLLPETRPVYLFQPYQLALGAIARWSGTDPLVAFVKFRSFLAPLTVVFLYSLLRWLTPTRTEAGAAFLVVLLFVILDIGTWESNSLFPSIRRGGVAAGLCVPTLLVLALAATRRVQDPRAASARRVALATAPVMFVAALTTHPLEMFPLLCFVGGLALTVLIGIDRAGDRRQTVLLMLLLALTTSVYLAVHSRSVPYVAEYERADRVQLRADLLQLASDPLQAIAGEPTEARNLLSRTVPATTAIVIGIPALALAVLRAPTAAAMLALGIVPLALLYASPAGYIVLNLLTSIETVRDVNAYFSLLGLVALALGLAALAQAALHAAAWRQNGFRQVIATSAVGSLVMWAGLAFSQQAVPWLGRRTMIQPELLLLLAVIIAAVVLVLAAMRIRSVLQPAPFRVGVVFATACLAIPLAIPEWGFGGVFAKREAVTAFTRFERAMASPSVLDWPAYYEVLKGSIAPRLPVPREVVDELRKQIPPRQVVLAHPRYSCALVVLIDAYCINPEFVYGHYFQPAAPYHAKYVIQNSQVPEHPFFNARPLLTDAEARLLRDYPVSYLLADPQYVNQTALKLKDAAVGATLVFDRDGYHLYRLPGS